MGKAEKLNFIENGKCFQTLPNLCPSKIERNCTLVNTNINLQVAYYILELQENLFFLISRAQRRIYNLSIIYDEAFSLILFPQKQGS